MGDDDSPPTVDRNKRQRTDKFSRLESLECFGEVRKMLMHGVSTPRVAEIVQEEHGEYDDVKKKSLERVLREYRSEEIPAGQKAAKNLPSEFEDEVDEVGEQLDVLQQLRELYELQRSRIEMNVEKEGDMDTLLGDTRKEIGMAMDILELVADLQMDFGLEDRELGTMKVEAGVASEAEDVMGEAMPSLTDPSKRNQLAEFVQSLDSTDPAAVQAAIAESEDGDRVIDVTPEDDDPEEGTDAD